MDASQPSVPPVVAVVVVHEPGPWFEDVLDGLASQNYPDLAFLFLVTGEPEGLPERIKRRLPKAYVRAVKSNAGFAATCNDALRLVEGSGFFCFMHDDVALDSDAIARLIEEVYRSNAGIVGPKLVEWDDPAVLQHVGLGVDRFGEIDPVIEPGELDQEQHDHVQDVFAVPSACMLVRADLFRSLGGFNAAYEYHGEDLDLCWRAHLAGARVLVVPAARARHREALGERRPDLAHRRMEADHRLRTVMTLSAGPRLVPLTLQLILLSVVETVIGLFTRHLRSGLASLGGLARLPLHVGQIVARRREIKPHRRVPDNEVVGLQIRGSARFSAFRRHRERLVAAKVRNRSVPARLRGARQSSGAVARALMTVALVVGSVRLIRHGVPEIGQFVKFPSPRAMLEQYTRGWSSASFGRSGASPTMTGLVGLAGYAVFGRVGLLRTLLVIGPLLAGFVGMWRLASLFPTSRARLGAVIVYAANPLPYAAVSTGRWAVAATYGALPWALHLGRRLCGLADVPGSLAADETIADAVTRRTRRDQLKAAATLALLSAVIFSVNPTFVVVVPVIMLLWVLATFLTGGSRSVLGGTAIVTAACAVGALLNLPWAASLLNSSGWSSIVGSGSSSPSGIGAARTAAFDIGHSTATLFALALYVPAAAATLVSRGWRLTWTARASFVVVAFGALAVFADRGSLPFAVPEVGLLLVPVAASLGLASGAALTAFEFDIRGARFGWRQPLGLLVSLCLVVGLIPGVIGIFDGGWNTPKRGLIAALRQLPEDSANGDYRVLWVGDPALIPVPSRPFDRGSGDTRIATAVVSDRYPVMDEYWQAESALGDAQVADALALAAEARSTRIGRLLAPMSIRYIVIPVDDGLRPGESRTVDSLASGLLGALSRQLDLRPVSSPDRIRVFENAAWLPPVAHLDPTAALASAQAGVEALTSLSSGTGAELFPGAMAAGKGAGPVEKGTVLLSIASPNDWTLSVDGTPVAPRLAYGWATAFDVPATGNAELSHGAGRLKQFLLAQLVAWAALAWVASGATLARFRRRRPELGEFVGDPLINLARSGDDSHDDDLDSEPVSEPALFEGNEIEPEGDADADAASAAPQPPRHVPAAVNLDDTPMPPLVASPLAIDEHRLAETESVTEPSAAGTDDEIGEPPIDDAPVARVRPRLLARKARHTDGEA